MTSRCRLLYTRNWRYWLELFEIKHEGGSLCYDFPVTLYDIPSSTQEVIISTEKEFFGEKIVEVAVRGDQPEIKHQVRIRGQSGHTTDQQS